jgi:hypothetical protein
MGALGMVAAQFRRRAGHGLQVPLPGWKSAKAEPKHMTNKIFTGIEPVRRSFCDTPQPAGSGGEAACGDKTERFFSARKFDVDNPFFAR